MANKPKKNQPETPNESQVRDSFWTPNYATDLLIPFLDVSFPVWECAAGSGRMTNRFLYHGFKVFSSEISETNCFKQANFLSDPIPSTFELGNKRNFAIVTNPPYSLKEKFYNRCLYYAVPFALLIPADYSGWIIEAVKGGAEKIIPTRRIDYITPSVLEIVFKGQLKRLIELETKVKYKKFNLIPDKIIEEYRNKVDKYSTVDEIPNKILQKYSASQFHSMWLTHGLGIGRTETFVDLTIEMKENIK
jgi:hypothetical protein